MPSRVNPFKPNSPVNPGMFVGRVQESERIEQHLIQTRAGFPAHFMIRGERGIGKSSLLNYFKSVAQGRIPLFVGSGDESESVSFLVLDTDVDRTTTQLGLIKKFELAMRKELGKSEPARAFLKDAWSFIQRLEGGGIKLNPASPDQADELLFEEFSYALAEVADRICNPEKAGEQVFSARYDGILLLLDEADNGSHELNLGTFLKLLTERLERRGCNRVMVGLAGLDELRGVLHESHPSSLRLFDDISLDRLTDAEVKSVIELCLDSANKVNSMKTVMADDAQQLLVAYSEGYPHFVQQFGFSSFDADSDGSIDQVDFTRGAFGKHGAMEQIGDRYYRDTFYNKIQQENYRQVLRIMADQLDSWVSKPEIRKRFVGSTSSLDNALKALRDRKIILSKEGARGIYRLEQKGFALWIKMYTTDPADYQRSLSNPQSEHDPTIG